LGLGSIVAALDRVFNIRMKESVIQLLEEETPLRMAQEPNYLPPKLKDWPPEKDFVMPVYKPKKRPFFLVSVLMFTITAIVYVKYFL
jgi:hypothetical protein